MSSFLCFVCHSTVNADTNEDTRDKYREVIGMHLCPDSHLCFICCHFLNKMCLFKSICLKRSLEYPVLFSEKGTINLQRSDTQVGILCPEDICLQHLNSKYHFYSDNENSHPDDYENSYVQLHKEMNFGLLPNNVEVQTDDIFAQLNDNLLRIDNDQYNNDEFLKENEVTRKVDEFIFGNDSIESPLDNINKIEMANLEEMSENITLTDLNVRHFEKFHDRNYYVDKHEVRNNEYIPTHVINRCDFPIRNTITNFVQTDEFIQSNVDNTIVHNFVEQKHVNNDIEQVLPSFTCKQLVVEQKPADKQVVVEPKLVIVERPHEIVENSDVVEKVKTNNDITDDSNEINEQDNCSSYDDQSRSPTEVDENSDTSYKIDDTKRNFETNKTELEPNISELEPNISELEPNISETEPNNLDLQQIKPELETNETELEPITSELETNKIDNETSQSDNELNKLKNNFIKLTLSLEEQKKELEANRKDENYAEAVFKCYSCAIGFLFKDSYQAHMMRHEESNGEHRCTVCKLRFAQLRVLRAHIANHSVRYQCQRCGQIIKARQRESHSSICFGVSKTSVSCHLCGNVYPGVSHLQQHLKRTHHNSGNRTYPCNVCGKSYSNQAAVRTHMITHINRKFTCEVCTCTFSSPYTLRQHHKKHESRPTELHYCETCRVGYTSRKSLLAHQRNALAHKERVYKCRVCDKSCPSLRSLHNHTKTIHIRSKDLVCEACPARYSTRKALLRHLATHSAIRPEKLPLCHACGETFKSTSILKRHLKNVCEKDKMAEELNNYFEQ